MAQVIKIKRSAVASKIPATTDLALGELAMNTNDGKLFMKKNNGTDAIVEIGAAQTASNVGASGVGVFNQKTGNNFEFKKLVAGTNMTVTDNGTTVTLDAASGGGGSGPLNSTQPGEYTFTVTLDPGGATLSTSQVSNLPAGWSVTVATSVIVVTHNLGRPPMGLTVYGSASATNGPYKVQVFTNGAGTFQLPATGTATLDLNRFQFTCTNTTASSVANGTVYVRVMF